MDRQDFDPIKQTNLSKVVDFCKRLQSAEGFNPKQQKRTSGSTTNSKYAQKKTKYSNTKRKPSTGGKWCEYHETDTHDTSECSVLKKMKESRKNKSSNKKPFNKNNTWTKKSNDVKKLSKKELNALVKKASKKVVKKATKELNTVAKCKRSTTTTT
jgi:hypothetical protein